jgi:ketosteroid isomerase-like protein
MRHFVDGAWAPRLTLFAVAALAFAAGCSRYPDHTRICDSLVATERSFARTVAELGIREGFLEYLGEGSITLEPGPVDARSWYEQSAESAAMLSWEPELVDASALGDLGFTIGPWQFRPFGPASSPSAFGHYVSVWKKGESGAWRVAFDGGIVHASEPFPSGPPEVRGLARVEAPSEPAPTLSELYSVDRGFAEEARELGFVEALANVASPDIRVLRSGALPSVGMGEARTLLEGAPGFVTWEIGGGGIAASGDLGYVYGTGQERTSADAPMAESAVAFMRIWERSSDGAWTVVLDFAKQLPPAPEGDDR